MKIGKFTVFKTVSFVLPKNDVAAFVIEPTPEFTTTMRVEVSLASDKDEQKNRISWVAKKDDNGLEVKITFLNADVAFGGATQSFLELGKIGNRPFGFLADFQTYPEAASFTINFMIKDDE